MAEKKSEPEFTVTDRRKFTAEGEVRRETPAEEREPAPALEQQSDAARPEAPGETAPAEPGSASPPPPSAAEQEAQREAFRQSTGELDERLRQQLGGRAKEFEMTFERFVASLYMTALLQLGLMREEGAPAPPGQVDLLGARQTIDTLGIIQDKTRGNLSLAEQNLLENCLYELRMAYVEVTNALTRPPQPNQPGVPGAKP